MKLVLATRGSDLALWQAQTTRARLLSAAPARTVELEIVHSSGDQDRVTAIERFGSIGVFSAEVDRAVAEARADVGVHSMKDLTTTLTGGVVLAGALARGPIEDVLIANESRDLDSLPRGARVATGSLRRRAMLLARRPDLDVVGIRGNVETRIAKLRDGAADALVLARAGLERLGLAHEITEILPVDDFLPAVGQGIVALTARADDLETQRSLAAILDREAFAEALAERALLRTLQGGCQAPIGANARAVESALALRARVLAADGAESIEGTRRGMVEDAEAIGVELAEELLGRGAARLLESARA